MNKEDISILITILLIYAITITPAILYCKRETTANKYCSEKYQDLEKIKTCKEIFYK